MNIPNSIGGYIDAGNKRLAVFGKKFNGPTAVCRYFGYGFVRIHTFFLCAMSSFRAFLIVSVFFFGGLSGLAKDIYVSQKFGDDRNSGGTAKSTDLLTGPVRTIKRALDLAENGDRVILDPSGGPYRESITLFGRQHSGFPNYPFIIEGQGAILDGTEPLPKGIWQHYRGDMYRFQPTMQPINFTFFHLLDNGKPLPKAASPSELQAGEWCFFQGFVYFRAEPQKTPMSGSRYEMSYSARMTGVTLLQVSNVRIHDLTIEGFQLDGVSAVNGAQDIILDNVTCRANGRSGITIGGASSLSAGYGTFTENLTTQVLSKPYSRGILFECDVPDNGTTSDGDEENRTLLIKKAE